MKKSMIKIGLIALGLEVLTRFYGLFAHGVSSIMMELMPITALIGGLILIGLKALIKDKQETVKWLDLCAITALALLINYQFMEGVLTIAGGSSTIGNWLLWLSVGFGMISLGILLWALLQKEPLKA